MAPGRPIILFEGHIFWRELKKRGLDPEKYVAGNENILYSSWRREHYYGGIREYERLDKQLEAFARFIKFAELRPNLERKDWTGFAKRYNGPGYAQNQYDKKLEEAYRRFTK